VQSAPTVPADWHVPLGPQKLPSAQTPFPAGSHGFVEHGCPSATGVTHILSQTRTRGDAHVAGVMHAPGAVSQLAPSDAAPSPISARSAAT
jgi:hypothetical protein